MAEQVQFKRGLQSALPATAQDGVFYLTTDSNRLYVGQGTKMALLNQTVQIVANVNSLPQSAQVNDFYYCSAENILAVYTGAEKGWVQINPDSGATNVTVTGNGNAITKAEYDAATRTITLTKETVFATKAELDSVDNKVDELEEYVGTIPQDGGDTIVEYIQKKAEEVLDAATGGSSESAASVKLQLDNYIESNDGRVKAVEDDVEELTEQVNTATQTANQAKQTATTASETANGAKATAETAAGDAAKAKEDAAAAKTDAEQAKQTAETAAENASQAKTTADAANKTAEEAKSKVEELDSKVDSVEEDIDDIQATLAKIANPMIYKGVVNSDVELTSKETGVEAGHTYMVGTAGTYNGKSAEVGDLFIWDGDDWAYVPAGDDADLDTTYTLGVNGTSVTLTASTGGAAQSVTFEAGQQIAVTNVSGKINIAHATITTTEATNGPITPAYQGTITYVSGVETENGHITKVNKTTAVLPALEWGTF